MNQTIRSQLTNIVFLVLIVAAALVIYLLSRAESGNANAGAQAASVTDTPAPTGDATKAPDMRGVPEAVFTTYLATSEVFSADQEKRGGRDYAISYSASSPQVQAKLRYEVQDGFLSSVEITFPLPTKYKNKGKTSIDAYLYEASLEQQAVLPDVVSAVLGELLPACDAKDELQLSSVRYWAEQAVQLAKVGDDFEDVLSGYRFLAYRSQGETAQELVCIFYLT